jgi:hypothetical protein
MSGKRSGCRLSFRLSAFFAREGDGIERRRHCGVGDGCCAAKVTALER